jgi:hypothetical protein
MGCKAEDNDSESNYDEVGFYDIAQMHIYYSQFLLCKPKYLCGVLNDTHKNSSDSLPSETLALMSA